VSLCFNRAPRHESVLEEWRYNTTHSLTLVLLDDRGSTVRFPTGAGNFSLHNRVQNGAGAQTASYLIGTRGSIPRGIAAGA
jgi:hypothetical protein